MKHRFDWWVYLIIVALLLFIGTGSVVFHFGAHIAMFLAIRRFLQNDYWQLKKQSRAKRVILNALIVTGFILGYFVFGIAVIIANGQSY